MEEGKKKSVMIAVIVVCFVAAGAIYLKTRPNRGGGGIPEYLANQKVWLRCRAPACEHEYDIVKKDYFERIEELRMKNPGDLAPAITCPKCGEPSVYEAVRCEKCGLVFEEGSVTGTYADTCPKCGYSKAKEAREAARKAKSGGAAKGE
ncbi:MAG: hypothetical protein ACYS21_16780 [Planctomycetota bacterium]|jgi:ssDNA-binding Zn-finger/Zn-ribbon topoisomerase 1